MDPVMPLPVSLALDAISWWLSSRALGAWAPDLGGGRRAALSTVGSTLVAVPAGWLADAAFAHAIATGVLLVAAGICSGAAAGALALQARRQAR